MDGGLEVESSFFGIEIVVHVARDGATGVMGREVGEGDDVFIDFGLDVDFLEVVVVAAEFWAFERDLRD